MPREQLQDAFLNKLRTEKIKVAIYLVSGIRLEGLIDRYDQFTIFLKNCNVKQMIFKHAISTVVPVQNVSFYSNSEETVDSQEREEEEGE